MPARKWSRDALLKNLQLIGELSTPLPPTLPPSPPASRSASPAPSVKRKAAPAPPESNKRPRTDTERPLHPPPPAEEGELQEDPTPVAGTSASAPAPAPPPPIVSPSAVPVRRPRAGKISIRQCETLHNKYHIAGRMLKYSGDARFWSTYPPSHKEYRALANPPPPNSPYYKHGGLIARLELLDALVCFTYSIWNRDYCRRHCSRETWYTIEAFLVWCKQKWAIEESTPDAEKAFLGLIWMIEGFIHGRKLVFTARNSPVTGDLDKLMMSSRAAVAAAASEAVSTHPSAATVGSLAPKSSATPVMLPSPASLAPSANSTPTNRDGGTPSSTAGSISSSSAPHPIAAAMAPSTLPSALLPSEYKHVPIAPHIASAMESVTVPVNPRLVNELKNEAMGITNAAYCMNNSQTYLNLPIMARFFPTTFARMISSTLSPNEEHEPDFEDEEGELFWPGQASTGEGLGWVCLMGKAMIKEFGKAYAYRGLDGVVPKPKPEEEAENSSLGFGNGQQQHLSGSTPLSHNSPLPLVR
ncbi:hypothetical protein C8F04DRAFT_1249036 [Mycena alexandri]|uniref:Uncharacterized protein n=1 Tax=Mycena alexandri TaxID=1745969 RepID=A0AAD6TI00_9AGAR|nr:hypothetical protein C8F04DRAFT_1249036 [Mycena alexandri]